MTEQEAIDDLKQYDDCAGLFVNVKHDTCIVAIKALEEIQQYRALGTPTQIYERIGALNDDYWKFSLCKDLEKMTNEYQKIGTVEELRVARDKQVAKKPICKEMPYSEEVGFNEEWHCPVCGAYIGYCTEGMSEPEQMEYCNECGQHIAKDWSDEDE